MKRKITMWSRPTDDVVHIIVERVEQADVQPSAALWS